MEYDVVVAGAGPVGLLLGCELRRLGMDVLVVDRLVEPAGTTVRAFCTPAQLNTSVCGACSTGSPRAWTP